MARKGTFKYKCDDCGEFTWLTRKQRDSRFRPRCLFCGSTYLDECTNLAKETNLNNKQMSEVLMDSIEGKMGFPPHKTK